MNQARIQIPGYTIIRKIGAGGMSEVFLAKQDSLKREVAVKVMRSRVTDDPKIIHRFMHEAETIAKLYHPNIVSIYEVGQLADDVIFYSMPYLPSGDLTDFNYETTDQLISLMLSISEGLNYAHQQGVIHRDIKPENILFDQFGQVQIADFGIAISANSKRLTNENHIVGSAAYMSPEQAQSKPVDARTDIYSLGVVLFELLAGHPPFKRDDDLATLMAHVNDTIPRLPEEASKWQEFIDRCLAKNPDDRYQTISSLQHALTNLHNEISDAAPVITANNRSNSSKALYAIPVIGLIALSVFLFNRSTENADTEQEPDFFTLERNQTIETPVTPPELEVINTAEITQQEADTLIAEAAERIEAFKLTLPEDDNALDRYLIVLKSYPEHEQAQQGIYAITLKYFELIGDEVSSGDYNQAGQFVDTVVSTWEKTGLESKNFAGETSLLLNTLNVQFNKERKRLRKDRAEQIFRIAERLTGSNQTVENFKQQLDQMPAAGMTLDGPDGIVTVIVPAKLSSQESSSYQGPDFAITRNEITRQQYAKFASTTNREPSKCRHLAARSLSFSSKNWQKPGIPQQNNHPAVCVSWNDAQAYAAWLSEQTGHRYRLPSRDELQHARQVQFAENRSICQRGNTAGTEAREMNTYGPLNDCDDNYRFTAPVGRFQSNRLGINDLFGNIREWTVNCPDSNDNASLLGKIVGSSACNYRYTAGESWRDGKPTNPPNAKETYFKNQQGYTHVGIRLIRQLNNP
ncbi:protein kinase [Marinicella sp. W31]|uniref:protein kinase domain-containing protein n=1 Tax=Marinicella sp. W31 TaxID=3023713 RepID=UPI00375827AC